MKYSFFTLGGRFFWKDIFYFQGWRIQRKVHTNRYRILDPYNIRRGSGSFEICKDAMMKYISACEVPNPPEEIVVIIHGFGRTHNSVKFLDQILKERNINSVIFNYCSLSENLKNNAEDLLTFIKNFVNSPRLYFITVGAGCLVLRKLFDVCDDYRTLNIKGIININPMNSGSDFAFVVSRFAPAKKLLGPMLFDITPDEVMRLSRVPQDLPLYLIFSPSKVSAMTKRLFSPLESFPQLSPPAESTYSQNIREMQNLSWFPLNNENMQVSCVEILDELMLKY